MNQQQGILNLYKAAGETPLERIHRFKDENFAYKDVPMTYAGRLDPLADGVLVVLAGEARHRREEFTKLPKTYEFEVLWGFASDTYDPLGIIRYVTEPKNIEETVKKALPRFRGTFELKYPAYSSRTMAGVPLWKLAREGKLEDVAIPAQKVTISDLAAGQTIWLTRAEIGRQIENKIDSVNGDFRQAEAKLSWRSALEHSKDEQFPVTHFKASVSSGTYIRSLADELGRASGCGGLAWQITRTLLGDFRIEDSVR